MSLMLLGQNVYRTVEREYRIVRTYTACARFEKCFLLCFFEPCFRITGGQVRICQSRDALSVIMRLYEIFEYRQILTETMTCTRKFRDKGRWLLQHQATLDRVRSKNIDQGWLHFGSESIIT